MTSFWLKTRYRRIQRSSGNGINLPQSLVLRLPSTLLAALCYPLFYIAFIIQHFIIIFLYSVAFHCSVDNNNNAVNFCSGISEVFARVRFVMLR